MSGTVSANLVGQVGTLTFSSPKANSMDTAMLREFSRSVTELSKAPDCRVIVVSSSGKTFCAGASLDEMKALSSVDDATEFFALFGRATAALRLVDQPVILRMQGKAVGGGVGLVAAADYAVGTSDAAVKLSEFQVGIGPFAISPVLEWKIGGAAALALSLSPDWKDAEWCLSRGLLSEMLPGEAALDKRISELSGQLVSCKPGAVSRFKQLCSSASSISKAVEERSRINAEILFSR